MHGVRGLGRVQPGEAGQRLGVIPFNVRGEDHYKVAAVLAHEGGIGVRNGYFCAHPYLLHLLKISSDEAVRQQQEVYAGTRVGRPGMVRANFGCYNTIEEVDHFVEVLARIAAHEFEGEYERDPISGAYRPRGFELDYDRYFVLKPGLRAAPRAIFPECGA